MSLAHPDVPGDIRLLRAFFESVPESAEVRNPHVEPPVSPEVRSKARDAAVLIAVIDDAIPRVIVTRRQPGIRFAGHLCFPGGTRDPEDPTIVHTALRETEEEVDLNPANIEVLGTLGDYYTQSGYRITPVVGVVTAPYELVPSPIEVAEIHEISFARMLQSDSYRLTSRGNDRAHFAFDEGDVRIGGPTVSLMIGLYESLLSFHRSN